MEHLIGAIRHFLSENAAQFLQALVLGFTGMAIGVGQLLRSEEKSRKKAIGYLIICFGLGMAASAVLTWFPGLPLGVQMGIAAVFANIGINGIKEVTGKITDRLTGKQ